MAWGRKRKPAKPDQRALLRDFIKAQIANDPGLVKSLLEAGLNFEARYEGTGRAVLHLCAQGGTVEIARMLIKHGADVNSLDPWGMTTVSIAARWGSEDMLRFFLNEGVDPNVGDSDRGMTPLHHVMCTDDDRTAHVRLLLDHGADPDVPSDGGRTARDMAGTRRGWRGESAPDYTALLPPKSDRAASAQPVPRRKPTADELGVRIATASDHMRSATLLADMFDAGQDLASLAVDRLHSKLRLEGARLVGTDYLDVLDGRPFAVDIQAGDYNVYLITASTSDSNDDPTPEDSGDERRVAFARVQFTDEPAVNWEPALLLGSRDWHGFGVDHGMAAFFDEQARPGLHKLAADVRWPTVLYEATASSRHDWAHVSFEGGSAVVCSTGWGDGFYSCFFGRAQSGHPCCLVADFAVVEWNRSDADEE